MRERIVMLDTLRGLGVMGILAVNMTFFAGPFALAFAVKGGAYTAAPASLAVWWVVNTVFASKFISLFSMLFGVSSFLVGGDGRDARRNRFLRRRLAWLAVFGAIHGALIWYGDVLLDYALCGAAVYFVRGWPGRRLVWVGGLLSLASTAGLTIWGLGKDQGWAPALAGFGPKPVVADFGGPFLASLRANLFTWTYFELFISVLTVPFALPLMLVGLGLFKLGVLTGERSTTLYRRLIAAGAVALAVSGASLAWQLAPSPPKWLGAAGEPLLDVTAPIMALGYAAALILVVKSGGAWLARWLAPVGRMAFTNYIGQSLIMTAIFYGGRGPGLFGHVDRPQLALIAAGVLLFQILLSRAWIAAFGSGPLEAVWRRLTYGREASGPAGA